LNVGDTVYIPAKILHTHGSVKNNQVFSHIALNFYPKNGTKPRTVWFESDLRSTVTGKIQ
jgi:quercetin dioxygenase-like cupin family protein